MFNREAIEKMITFALGEEGVDVLIDSCKSNMNAVTRYSDFLVRIHERAFASVDEAIDLQNLAEMMQEFDHETSNFMNTFAAAENITGSDVSMADIFGSERLGRPELMVKVAAKFVLLFAVTWKTLNVIENEIGRENLSGKLMKVKKKNVAQML